MREIVDLVESDARTHRVPLRLDLADPLPHIVVDGGGQRADTRVHLVSKPIDANLPLGLLKTMLS